MGPATRPRLRQCLSAHAAIRMGLELCGFHTSPGLHPDYEAISPGRRAGQLGTLNVDRDAGEYRPSMHARASAAGICTPRRIEQHLHNHMHLDRGTGISIVWARARGERGGHLEPMIMRSTCMRSAYLCLLSTPTG